MKSKKLKKRTFLFLVGSTTFFVILGTFYLLKMKSVSLFPSGIEPAPAMQNVPKAVYQTSYFWTLALFAGLSLVSMPYRMSLQKRRR